MTPQDLIGNEMTESEVRLLAVYSELKALCAEDLPPVAASNVRAALALIRPRPSRPASACPAG